MARVLAVPPLPDVENLWGLLRFLTDAEAVQARLTQLEAYKVELDSTLATIGQAEDWEAARTQARADRQMASETLAHAKAEAKRLTGAALEERDAAVAEAARVRQAVAQERAVLDREIQQAATAAATRDAALVTRERAAEAAQRAASESLQTTTALKAELDARLARLRAAAVEAGT